MHAATQQELKLSDGEAADIARLIVASKDADRLKQLAHALTKSVEHSKGFGEQWNSQPT